jgi:RNA polymerase sigma-70 factor (ECF subfamily)
VQSVAEPRELATVAERTDEATRAALFEDAYRSCRLPVYRYLRTLTRSEDAATELAAVTFERAFAGFDRFEAGREALPWLLRIARNAAIDAGRRSRPTIDIEGIPPTRQPLASTPEDAALLAERDTELRELVAALPEPQRDAIALRYAAGLTAREIGAVIGKSEAATQKTLLRALDALREAHHARR